MQMDADSLPQYMCYSEVIQTFWVGTWNIPEIIWGPK